MFSTSPASCVAHAAVPLLTNQHESCPPVPRSYAGDSTPGPNVHAGTYAVAAGPPLDGVRFHAFLAEGLGQESTKLNDLKSRDLESRLMRGLEEAEKKFFLWNYATWLRPMQNEGVSNPTLNPNPNSYLLNNPNSSNSF